MRPLKENRIVVSTALTYAGVSCYLKRNDVSGTHYEESVIIPGAVCAHCQVREPLDQLSYMLETHISRALVVRSNSRRPLTSWRELV